MNNSNTLNTTKINLSVIIIEACLSFEIIILNLLTALIIAIWIKAKTYSNIIFLLISLVDLMVGLVSIPGDILLKLNYHWLFNSSLCVFYKTFDNASSTLSLFMLLMITMHRYLQLKNPYIQKEEMNRWRWLWIGLICVFVYASWALIWKVYFDSDDTKSSTCYFDNHSLFIYIYYGLILVLPFFLIILVNILLIRLFVIKKKRTSLGESKNKKKEDNAIYCVLSITANLIFCWSIYFIIWIIKKI